MGRSTMYPVVNLHDAIEKVQQLVKSVGLGPFSRETAVKGMNYSSLSGASGRAFSALVQYGLIDRLSKDDYKVSSVATRITNPISSEDYELAKEEAAKSPKLFSELFNRFEGQEIPDQLENILFNQKEYKFANHKSAQDAATNFRQTAESIVKNQTRNSTDSFLREESTSQTSPPPTSEVAGSTKLLPSGIAIGFPPEYDYALMTGEFGNEIKNLEKKAQQIKSLVIQGSENEEVGL